MSSSLRSTPALATDRLASIAAWLETHGRVDVADLAERLSVSPETIRRDLRTLESAGRLQRVHGGAVPVGESQLSLTVPGEGGPIDATFGAQVWAGLPRTGNILLGAGALSLSLAQAIVNDPPQQTGLTIVTNYLDAAVVLSRSSQLAVYNIGGTVSATTRAQEGDWAVAELERLHTDIALICPEGISVERGLSQSTPAAAAISQAEVTAGGRVIALVEAETLGTDSFIRYAGIGEVDQLAIHGQPSSTQLLPFTDRGVSVSVVGEP